MADLIIRSDHVLGWTLGPCSPEILPCVFFFKQVAFWWLPVHECKGGDSRLVFSLKSFHVCSPLISDLLDYLQHAASVRERQTYVHISAVRVLQAMRDTTTSTSTWRKEASVAWPCCSLATWPSATCGNTTTSVRVYCFYYFQCLVFTF